MREKPVERWEPLVEAVAGAVAPYLDRPYALFGHSMGAMLAFELARLQRRTGGPLPLHLFPSGRPAPHVPRDEFTHDLPEPEFVDELRAMGGVPEEVLANRELMGLLLPLLRADMSVNERYEYREEPPLDIPMTAYGGTADHRVSREELEAWERHTTGPFRARFFEGDHFYLQAKRDAVLAALSADLGQLLSR
jgi:medium-chain acyl-[acyl-carrier-protein] hydrolase